LAKRVDPLIPDIVRAARDNMDWPAFGAFSTGDSYVAMAMRVLKMRAKVKIDMPKREEDLELVCEELLTHCDFSGCELRRSHTKAFIKAVLREAYLKPQQDQAG
jgi:hypothetical protein